MSNELSVKDQMLCIMFQLNQQGVENITQAEMLIMLGVDEDEIEPEAHQVILTVSEEALAEGELIFARLTNQIH